MKGNQNYLELAGGFLHYSKCKKEIQGKSTLVRVSARFKLARVRVIGRQLQKLLGYKRLEILYLSNLYGIFQNHQSTLDRLLLYERNVLSMDRIDFGSIIIVSSLNKFRKIYLTFHMWNELTFWWNELTILWNDLTWNDLTMERKE